MRGLKKKILLVEDELITGLAQKMSLEKMDYVVVGATSGEDAVKKVRDNSDIELILMDIDLGSGIDGTEAAKIILSEKKIPVVFLSNHTEPDVVEKTEKITSYGYVVKNSGITVLDASIKMAFKLFDANRIITEKEIIQKTVLSNISDVIGIATDNLELGYISPNVEKWFGWLPDEIIGSDIFKTVYPDDSEFVAESCSTVLNGEKSVQTIEIRLICGDGRLKPVELTIINLFDEPVINGLLLNYHDITERKGFETELIKTMEESGEREVHLQGILSSLDEVIVSRDKNNRTIFFNKAFDLITRKIFNQKAYVGMNTLEFLSDEERAYWSNVLSKVLTGETHTHEYEYPMPDNTIGNFVSTHIPLVYGDKTLGTLEITRDVTELRKRGNALFESERRYRSLFDNMTEGFALHEIVYDETGEAVDYRFLDINPAFERLTGLRKEEIVGRSQKEVIPGEDPFWFETYLGVVRTGEPVHLEHYSPALDRYYSVFAYRPDDKQFAVIFGDISERKESEKRAEWNRALLNTVIGNSTEAVFVKNTDGEYILINESGAAMLGLKPDEIIGKKDSDIIPFETAEKFRETDLAVMKSGEMVIMEERGLVDGEEKVFLASKAPWFGSDGEMAGITGTSMDITELKKSEEETRNKNIELLQLNEELNAALEELESGNEELSAMNESILESEKRLNYYLENSPLAIIEWNSDLVIIRWGGDSEKIFGWSVSEAIGSKVTDLNLVFEGDGEKMRKTVKKMNHGDTVKIVSTNRNRTKDGRVILCEWYSIVIHDAVGGLKSVLSQGIDITERMEAGDKVRSLLAEKELMLKEVHHRIKNNMNSIMGILLLQADSSDYPPVADALINAGNRIGRMMLLYDRLYRSQNFGAVSGREYFPTLVNEVVSNFPNSDIVDVEMDIGEFFIDDQVAVPAAIVINEIVTNMMKYAFQGRERGRISLSAHMNNHRLKLIIEDNGVGMPEMSVIGNIEGFGMKLVTMLVEQNNGSIKIERGAGTKFLLEFGL